MVTQGPVLEKVAASLGRRAVRQAPLGARTTYRVGGTAAVLVEVETEDDLVFVHRALVETGGAGTVPVLVVGNGSNMLVADGGFDGLVLVPGTALSGIEITGATVRAGGGAQLPLAARRSAAAGLVGLEWAVGVPGTVGGAVKMNAGGHGSDTAAVLSRVRLFDLGTGRATECGGEDLAFGYRHSNVAADQVVVWAEFALAAGERAGAEAEVAEIVRWRRAHQPGGSNAGSVFTNPDGDAAGRLVEAAGLKGFRLGTARVSEKHANFIQADDGGSANDVKRLIEHVRQAVGQGTGVDLVPEVVLVGFDDEEVGKPSTSCGGSRS